MEYYAILCNILLDYKMFLNIQAINKIIAGQNVDKSIFAAVLNTNDGSKGFKCPMKETAAGVDNRCPPLRLVISLRTSKWACACTKASPISPLW